MLAGHSPEMTPNILNLPFEVLHAILVLVEPDDLARLCCCRPLYKYIKGNRLLFKQVYLREFDNPSNGSNDDFAWEQELPKLVRFQKILQSNDIELRKSHMDMVVSSTEHLLASASRNAEKSLNLGCLRKLFGDPSKVQDLLCGSFLFHLATMEMSTKRPRAPARSDSQSTTTSADSSSQDGEKDPSNLAMSPELLSSAADLKARQTSAKMHVLYGVPYTHLPRQSKDFTRYNLRSESQNPKAMHPFARSMVYDLRRYTEANFWGPFMDDYSQDADWEKLEALMVLLDYSLKDYAEAFEYDKTVIPRWDLPFAGASHHSFVSPPFKVPREPKLPLEAQDPYNLTGTWRRIVCFLDYNDLYDFNFRSPIPEDQPRPPLEREEAFRLINMQIEVAKIRPPGEDDGQALPVVEFKGMSAAVRPSWDPHANAKIRVKGLVRLTPEGEVRWTSWSIFHGEERWRSEGIQIGGPQSARGVLGTWFDKDFDEHGPAGPTCFWKVTDEMTDIKAPVNAP